MTTEAALCLLEDEEVALVKTTVGQRKMLQDALKVFQVPSEQCTPAETTVPGSSTYLVPSLNIRIV